MLLGTYKVSDFNKITLLTVFLVDSAVGVGSKYQITTIVSIKTHAIQIDGLLIVWLIVLRAKSKLLTLIMVQLNLYS